MNRKKIIIIVIVLIFLAVILTGIFLWWPKYQEFTVLREDVKERRVALEQKIIYFKGLEELSKKTENYQEEFDKIESAFPEDPSIPAILRFIQTTASENGLITDNLGGYNISSGAEFRNINFSGSFSGSYAALKSFLSAVYQNTRIIEVEYITFEAPTEGGVFNLRLDFRTHAFPVQKEGQELEGAFPLPQ